MLVEGPANTANPPFGGFLNDLNVFVLGLCENIPMLIDTEQLQTRKREDVLGELGRLRCCSFVYFRNNDQRAARLSTLKTSRMSAGKSGHQKWVSTAVTKSNIPSANGN